MVGFGLVCLGTWFRVITTFIGLYQMNEQKTTPFTFGVTALVISGILIMMVAVLGNHGACSHKKSALNVFSGLLSFLIIINIAVGVTAFMWRGEMSDRLGNFYTKIYTQYPHTRRNNETMVLKLFHKTLDCCGIGEPIEQFVLDTCPEGNIPKQIPFNRCPRVIQDMFNSNAPLVLCGFLGMAGIMMVALVCSVVLSRHISQSPASPSENGSQWEAIHRQCIQNLCRDLLSS
ncbi:CD9 antigen-like isoform X2 [Sinocyclocheilus grahami]|nr:PREDICTED: CD9 antigen-like isoform X2 [Sinocyclocheilus grahami]